MTCRCSTKPLPEQNRITSITWHQWANLQILYIWLAKPNWITVVGSVNFTVQPVKHANVLVWWASMPYFSSCFCLHFNVQFSSLNMAWQVTLGRMTRAPCFCWLTSWSWRHNALVQEDSQPIVMRDNTAVDWFTAITFIWLWKWWWSWILSTTTLTNTPRAPIQYKDAILPVYENPIVEIRRSYDRLISTMGFPILVRWHLYIELGPRAIRPSLKILSLNC